MLKIILICFAVLLYVGQTQAGTTSPSKKAKTRRQPGLYWSWHRFQSIMKKLQKIERKIDALKPGGGTDCKNGHVPRNCAEVYKDCGWKRSGVYIINPDGRPKGKFKVYCDQKTSGGGWTVFQRRVDGSVDFYRDWNDYKNGFGDLHGEHWLGLDKINRLTNNGENTLRVDIANADGKTAYAEYKYFDVNSEKQKYRLHLGSYSGTAGDSLRYHNGAAFSTKDTDNDTNGGKCAVSYKGGWWFKSCLYSNLNGLYTHATTSSGISWYYWKRSWYSYKRAQMKLRPRGYKSQ